MFATCQSMIFYGSCEQQQLQAIEEEEEEEEEEGEEGEEEEEEEEEAEEEQQENQEPPQEQNMTTTIGASDETKIIEQDNNKQATNTKTNIVDMQQQSKQEEPAIKADVNVNASHQRKVLLAQQQQPQHTLLSPKRLISEHQARQQKALFRALAERQRILDELKERERRNDNNHQDLNNSSNKSTNNNNNDGARLKKGKKCELRRRRRRRRRKGSPQLHRNKRQQLQQQNNDKNNKQQNDKSVKILPEEGVPLSAVDLSSISDRMLDDLLRHIASASSSSSVSSSSSGSSSDEGGESLDSYSSDISSSKCPNSSSCSSDEAGDEENDDLTTTTTTRTTYSSSYCSSSDEGDINYARTMAASSRHKMSHHHHHHHRSQQNHHQLASTINSIQAANNQLNQHINASISHDAPNVIGIHENERSRNSELRRRRRSSGLRNCRDTYRRHRCDKEEDDDDDHQDHELVVDTNINSPASNSNSNSTNHSHQQAESEVSASYDDTSTTSGVVVTTNEFMIGNNNNNNNGKHLSSSSAFVDSTYSSNSTAADLVNSSSCKTSDITKLTRDYDEDQMLDTVAINHSSDTKNKTTPARKPMKSVLMINCSTPSSPSSLSSPLQLTTSIVSNSNPIASSRVSLAPVINEASSIQVLTDGAGPAATDTDTKEAVAFTKPADITTTSVNADGIIGAAKLDIGSNLTPVTCERLSASLLMSPSKSKSKFDDEDGPTTLSKSEQKLTLEDTKTLASSSSVTKKKLQQPRQQFKTCVNIGAPSNNNISPTPRFIVSPTPRPLSSDASPTTTPLTSASSNNQPLIIKNCLEPEAKTLPKQQDNTSTQQENNKSNEEEVQIVEVINDKQQLFERRRSSRRSRSSLRRRPSFSGSTKEPRAGSPIPISILQHQQAIDFDLVNEKEKSLESNETTMNDNSEHHKQQKQLQRALILAQKYNYSPAKLATSKLSSKLQLKDLTSSNQQQACVFETDKPGQQQQHRIALNGSKALNSTWNGPATAQANKSNNSITSGDNNQEPIRVTGQVQLDVSYFAKSGSLTVHIMQCTQLAPVSKRRTTSNPYVKLYLLPDKNKSGKRKSAVHKNELNPRFDEKFTFGPALQLADFDEKVLWLSVWHKDRYLSRNDFLGEILLPLSQVRQQLLSSDLCQSTGPLWYSLNERFDPAAYSKSRKLLNQQQQQLIASSKGNHQTNEINTTTSSVTTTEQQQKQLQTTTLKSNTTNNGKLMTIKRQTDLSKQQAELVGKLSELQKKAAQLTETVTTTSGAVAPPTGHQQNMKLKPMMNAQLAPRQQAYPYHSSDHQQTRISGENNQQLSVPVMNITGQLFVALKFVPENGQLISASRAPPVNQHVNGELHVIIKEAHNIGGFEAPLVVMDGNNKASRRLPTGPLPNPFCKCYLLDSNGQRVSKQKTPALKRTSNPKWDYKCVFNSVKLSNLTCQAIEIQMFNRDSILVSNNEPLGGIRLCLNGSSTTTTTFTSGSTTTTTTTTNTKWNEHAGGQQQQPDEEQEEDEEALCSERESKLWAQMLARPNIWVYGELRLRSLRPLITKTTSFD